MGRTNEDTDSKREVEAMLSTAKQLLREDSLAAEVREYIAALKDQEKKAPDETRLEAISALQRMGLLTENGERKEKIVSWE